MWQKKGNYPVRCIADCAKIIVLLQNSNVLESQAHLSFILFWFVLFFIFYYVHYTMLCYTMTPWQVWFRYIGLLLELYGPDGEDVFFLSEKCTKYLQCGLISKIIYIIQMNIMRMEWSFPSAKVMNKLWWSTHFFLGNRAPFPEITSIFLQEKSSKLGMRSLCCCICKYHLIFP